MNLIRQLQCSSRRGQPLGANSYAIKLVKLEPHTEMLRGIYRYWFNIVSVLS